MGNSQTLAFLKVSAREVVTKLEIHSEVNVNLLRVKHSTGFFLCLYILAMGSDGHGGTGDRPLIRGFTSLRDVVPQ